MNLKEQSVDKLLEEISRLEQEKTALLDKLNQAEESIETIKSENIDALLILKDETTKIFTTKTADQTYRLFIEKMSEGAVTLSNDGIILFSNARFAHMVNVPLEQVFGSVFIDYIPAHCKKDFERFLEIAWVRDIKGELNILNFKGESTPVVLSFFRLPLQDSLALCIVLTDLTKLKEAQNKLEEEIKAEEQFLAEMSHEIRTPMNAIIGFTKLILKTNLSPEQQQNIHAIKTSGENLLVIINDILDFSKIKAGKIILEQIEFSLSKLIVDLRDLMLPKCVEKNIALLTGIDKNIPDNLTGDPTRLTQILLNLVRNAINFTEQGEVKINVALQSESEDIVDLEFSVTDTGIGISENQLNSIFERFTQANKETTRKYGGSGLGLSIVKQLVELQGGSLSVNSKIGAGSTFCVHLKFKKSLHHQPKETTFFEEQHTTEIEGLNVLLVEDNVLNQILAQKVLENWNWQVDTAENGKIAIEKLEKNKYDVLLMDIQMPEMNGYETTRYIRENMSYPKSATPIIAMTAQAMQGESEKCKEAGMDGYISKPFDEKELYAIILSVIRVPGNVALKE